MRTTSRRAVLAALVLATAAPALRAEADVSAVGRIRMEDFKKDYDDDKVLVIDVRAPESYNAGHIAGAINVPLSSLTEHLAKLKAAKKPIVAYCAWPSEHSSARAAQLLDEAGVKGVRALVGGYNAWVAAGYPLVKGDQPR